MTIKGDGLKSLIVYLIGTYFLFSSLDYVVKVNNGASFLRVVGIAIYCLAFLRLIIIRKLTIRKEHILLLYLMIIPFIASLWAVNVNKGIDKAVTIFTTILVVFLTFDLELDDKQIRIIEVLSIVGAIIAGLYWIQTQGLQSVFSGKRVYLSGNMDTSDPNGLAARLFLPMVLSLKMGLEARKNKNKILAMMVFIFILLFFLLCGSRGAMLAGIVVVIYALVKNANIRGFRRIGVFLFFGILFTAFVLFAEKILPPYIYNRLFVSENYISASSRLFLWQYYFENYFWQSTMIGFGTFGVYYTLGGLVSREYYAMHNSYISMIGEYGVLYLPAFFVLLVYVYRRTMKKKEMFAICAFLGVCVIIFFLDGYETKYFWNTILYCFLVSNEKDQRVLNG